MIKEEIVHTSIKQLTSYIWYWNNIIYVDKDKNYHITKNLTPLKFYKEIVPMDLNDYVSIINSPTADKPFNKVYTVDFLGNVLEGNEIIYLNLEIERLKELAVSQLKDGETVWFG